MCITITPQSLLWAIYASKGMLMNLVPNGVNIPDWVANFSAKKISAIVQMAGFFQVWSLLLLFCDLAANNGRRCNFFLTSMKFEHALLLFDTQSIYVQGLTEQPICV